MFAPNTRQLLLEALRPPSGFNVDAAIGTTYTLALDALLIPPAAWAMHAADRLGATDPILLANSLRHYARRTLVFHQAGAAAPFGVGSHELSAFLDEMVFPITVKRHSTFHPKVWIVRYRSEHDRDEFGLRVLIGSRNLTLDTSWDALVRLDSTVPSTGTAPGSSLSALLRSMPGRSTVKLSPDRSELLESLAVDLETTHFRAPEGCVTAEIIWWSSEGAPRSLFPTSCTQSMVMSPFLGADGLRRAPTPGVGGRAVLVSRPQSLESVCPSGYDTYSLRTDLVEIEAGAEDRFDGDLHAKVFAFDEADRSTVIVGSANATGAAFQHNDEVVVRFTGQTERIGVSALLGDHEAAEATDDLELIDLLDRWTGTELASDLDVGEDERFFEAAIRAVASVPIVGECAAVDGTDDYDVTIRFVRTWLIPNGILVDFRFITQADRLPIELIAGDDVTVRLPLGDVTRMVVARFFDSTGIHSDEHVVLFADVEMPEGRSHRALRALISNPERFARFLRYLLEQSRSAPVDDGEGPIGRGRTRHVGSGSRWVDDGPILEQLLRLLARDPDELRYLDAVITEFKDALDILPPGFAGMWDAIRPLITGSLTDGPEADAGAT